LTREEAHIYYHRHPLKYVEYGKVFPHCDDDNWLLTAYRWLGHYCGYCPQVWLSRGNQRMTGYRNSFFGKAPKRNETDGIMFCFDLIRGFPVDYEFWCGCFLNTAINMPDASPAEISGKVAVRLDESVQDLRDEDAEGHAAGKYPLESAWEKFRPDFDAFLKGYVFVERDQIVVPSLNLKAAKKVVCRDERQKKTLRRMGFIEDRIEIRNTPR
jgi:hypothetical protein